MTKFDAPAQIQYAKGTSIIVFGKFVTWGIPLDRQPAVLFTAVNYNRKDRRSVAVCLYGSMDNFLEYVQSTGPAFDGGRLQEGWVSSAAPAVYNFIKSHGKQLDSPCSTRADMAIEALKIADGQGVYRSFNEWDLGLSRPWSRSYTYGDTQAQWMARIYLDVDLEAEGIGRVDGYRRVLIGAPLWIRTPAPHAIRLYASSDDPDIQFERILQSERGVPEIE